jgi:hypothetical protein
MEMMKQAHRAKVKADRYQRRMARFISWRYGSLLNCAVCAVPLLLHVGCLNLCELCLVNLW